MIYLRPSGLLGHLMGLKRSRVEHDKVSPVRCEVCRKQPATMIVVDFILACDECAAKIETAIRPSAKQPYPSRTIFTTITPKEKSMSNSPSKGTAVITGAPTANCSILRRPLDIEAGC